MNHYRMNPAAATSWFGERRSLIPADGTRISSLFSSEPSPSPFCWYLSPHDDGCSRRNSLVLPHFYVVMLDFFHSLLTWVRWWSWGRMDKMEEGEEDVMGRYGWKFCTCPFHTRHQIDPLFFSFFLNDSYHDRSSLPWLWWMEMTMVGNGSNQLLTPRDSFSGWRAWWNYCLESLSSRHHPVLPTLTRSPPLP